MGIYSNYRKEKTLSGNSSEDINGMIRVVPPSSWFALLGGILVLLGIIFWMCTTWVTAAVSFSGYYIPSSSEYGEIICFVPLAKGRSVSTGMPFSAHLDTYNYSTYGNLTGVVSYTSPYVATYEEVFPFVDDASLANLIYNDSPLTIVICKLDEDPNSQNGFLWTNPRGSTITLQNATPINVNVIVSKEKPFSNLFSGDNT